MFIWMIQASGLLGNQARKLQRSLGLLLANPLLGMCPKGLKVPNEDFRMDVPSSTIHNSPKGEATQVSIPG